MELTDLSTIQAVLKRHGFRFSKSLGQNFLIDPAVCPRMARECGADETTGVLEVGPGFGVLTRELSARAGRVVAVELDKGLLPVLGETLGSCRNVEIVQGDVLKLDLAELLKEKFGTMKISVCANLPYYITSPVLMRFLEERLPVSSLTVMVQKEAARRLCAPPGSRDCGAVSAAVSYYAKPQILFEVPRTSFYPRPNVDSAVIRLDVLDGPAVRVLSEKGFFALVRAAFGKRRKTILNSVSSGLGLEKEQVLRVLQDVGIPPATRAERLTLPQLADFANGLEELK
ncbi:Ribosomal RNA small subunit methyltransferase A [Caprobacter fermentans]|uniref:Ribosomal RNA small subunit methyltransferase A n=1 Tax=Caproicibacter fermentans TaxID=2576756 RepID=A0A6N8HZU6_9FIRM|nr:16S rRNA (adenine(1518)-N(6)/adenine(1519)-N(6))-dimethyltransferase RsmA [Caproicibacter fermentans]MVB11282.1 Ribosomal RNA small subunit methyltransferase A [Caproicibacter fermentans]